MSTRQSLNTGTTELGLRYATLGNHKSVSYKIVAHNNGAYTRFRRLPSYSTWMLFPDGQEMPRNIEQALCKALGIEVKAS